MNYLKLIPVCILALSACSKPQETPELVHFDYEDLEHIRKDLKNKEGNTQAAYSKLITEADKLLPLEPLTVTAGDIPPTGDKHDFFAIGKYTWPNPDTPDGMPYIRIDCKINPESGGDRYDLSRYNKTIDRIKKLSWAWYYSREEKYATKATELLRVWFLNEDTRMNPNLECASSLPGVCNGMANGIIFGVTLVEMIDCVKLLAQSNTWTTTDGDALKAWFAAFKTWLLDSELGKTERKSNSNHGSWYVAQVLAYSLYSGDTREVAELTERAKVLIDKQIDTDGSLPMEKHREWSFHYSIYGIEGLAIMASAAEHFGTDIWHYTTTDGRGLEAAFRFLEPYLSDKETWPWGTIRANNNIHLAGLPLMRRAAKKYNSPGMREVAVYLETIAPADAEKAWLFSRTTPQKQ